ncbi:MAG: hypothetical protein JRI35_08345 [Deltaproteobacteria bacterium]|nr:hypothetical protein [Deltaproteobacteria bacterium]
MHISPPHRKGKDIRGRNFRLGPYLVSRPKGAIILGDPEPEIMDEEVDPVS